jgi:hypothetical protein
LDFLKEKSNRAFYSTEVVRLLEDKGVKKADIMTTARRYADRVLVRGINTQEKANSVQGGIPAYLDRSKQRGGELLS